MKKLIGLMTFLTLAQNLFAADITSLSQELKEWEKDCYTNTDPRSSKINFHTEKFTKILAKGPIIAELLIMEYKNGNENAGIFFPPLFKTVIESSFDKKNKIWTFSDYPAYICSPPAFHPDKQKLKQKNIWIYWWEEGRSLTPEIFKRKYDDYAKAKTVKNDEEIKKTYTLLQNMGIIILPNLLEKIESGESDLIPMFSYLTNDKVAKDATAEDCKKFWNENKSNYDAILNYPNQIVSVTQNDVSISGKLKQKIYKPDVPIAIKVKWENMSTQDISFVLTNFIGDISWNIIDSATKKTIPYTQLGKNAVDPHREIFSRILITVSPGKDYSMSFDITPYFEFQPGGKYELNFGGSFQQDGKKVDYQLKGLTIEIVPKESTDKKED